jgi:organic radical activating enzyme
MMNQQKPEQVWMDPDGRLAVREVFRSIQGEGPDAGEPAVFVRLAGCNLCCPWCDTDYTSERTIYRPGELVELIDQQGSGMVVLTGGEPFRQNIVPLIVALSISWRVQIETNGSLPFFGPVSKVSVICSPKTSKLGAGMAERVDALKYVGKAGMLDPDDGLPIGLARVPGVPVFLQPMDEGNEANNRANLEAVIDSCLEHGYRLSIQLHKLVGMP